MQKITVENEDGSKITYFGLIVRRSIAPEVTDVVTPEGVSELGNRGCGSLDLRIEFKSIERK